MMDSSMMMVFVILLVSPLCVDTIAPTIQATSAGLTIKQGQAAYITEKVAIKCKWDPFLDSTYEIWLDDGAQRTLLRSGNTSNVRTGSHVHIQLTTQSFRSGKYECVIRSGNEAMNSSVYLFSTPEVYLKRGKDAWGQSRSANFFCDVQDDSSQWTNICREIEYRYRNVSDSNDKVTHSISSPPGGDWQPNGANLTIFNVEELAVNVIVWCRVNGLKVCMDNVSPPSNGNFTWSKSVSIDVDAPPSPTNDTTSPTISQSSVLVTSIGSTCAVVVALAALVAVVAIALIVVVIKRKNRQILPMPCTAPFATDPEQGLPEHTTVRNPGNGQDTLTQVYLMDGNEQQTGRSSSSHDPRQVEQLPPGAYCEPSATMVANDPQQYRQPGDGQA